jgi:ribose transport system ATP-binding protein
MSYLEIRNLSKRFGAVQALFKAAISIDRGTVHGICGANGAGKSTLIRILAGATTPDDGEVIINGEAVREFTPHHSTSLGIGVVHQELALVPELPVFKNIFLGIESHRGPLLQTRAMKERAEEILGRMGVHLDVEVRVGELGLHQQQIVEIAKALCRGTSLLILDEPTAILNLEEKAKLFNILRELKQDGLCIILITHFIGELFEVCDGLTIMRDGRTVETLAVAQSTPSAVISAMVGAVADHRHSPPIREEGRRPILTIHEGAIARKFADVGFSVSEGEIVGLAGLVGSGCYEVAEALFGLRQLERGQIYLDGRPARLSNPRAAARAGIGFVPEDRRKKGLCLNLSGSSNIVLPSLSQRRFSWGGIIRRRSVHDEFVRIGQRLKLRPLDPMLPAAGFSGGGQQKLVIGKWIEKRCRVYILVEPTRGVDVGAKVEIWNIIEELGRDGGAVILVSTDFDDIAAVCSRCLIFRSGRVSAELRRPHITADSISTMAIAED